VQAFVAADITASWSLFITTRVQPGTFTIPGRTFHCLGTRSSKGTRTPGYQLIGLHVTWLSGFVFVSLMLLHPIHTLRLISTLILCIVSEHFLKNSWKFLTPANVG